MPARRAGESQHESCIYLHCAAEHRTAPLYTALHCTTRCCRAPCHVALRPASRHFPTSHKRRTLISYLVKPDLVLVSYPSSRAYYDHQPGEPLCRAALVGQTQPRHAPWGRGRVQSFAGQLTYVHTYSCLAIAAAPVRASQLPCHFRLPVPRLLGGWSLSWSLHMHGGEGGNCGEIGSANAPARQPSAFPAVCFRPPLLVVGGSGVGNPPRQQRIEK